MVNRAWTVRPYAAGDEESLLRLYKLVYDREITVQHWRWKLKGRPTPVDNVWLAVDSSNVPIFHIGGIPCQINHHGQEYAAFVMVDAMTHPAFRRRGVLTAVWREMMASWKTADCRVLLGLPNEQWRSRKSALGWQPLFPLARLVRPLRPDHLLGKRLGLRRNLEANALAHVWNELWDSRGTRSEHLEFRELSGIDSSIDTLWRSVAPEAGYAVVRDRSWVRWRYRDAPHLSYSIVVGERNREPVAFAAYRFRLSSIGTIVVVPDMFAVNEPSVLGALVSEVVTRAITGGAEAVMVMTARHSRLHRALRKRGFLRQGSFGAECVVLRDEMSLADLQRPSAWHMTGGDFDIAY